MTRLRLLAAFALLAGLAARPPLAAGEDSQWTPPAPAPGPGAPSHSPEGQYASSDRRRLDEQRRQGVLDQLCRNFRLEKKFDLPLPRSLGLDLNTTFAVNRRTQPDIDGSLVLIDQEELAAGSSLSRGRPIGAEGGVTVSAGAQLSGDSIVIRRLGSFNSCAELERVIDVTDVKLAAPFTAKRIAAMEPGELWRLPMTITLSAGAGASDSRAGTASVTLGYSRSKTGTASMTLWRLSEHRARFKFRVDYVKVESASAGLSAAMSPIEYAHDSGGLLKRFVDGQIADQLRRYTDAYLSLATADSRGDRLLLEFVADPTVPEQAQALADALGGNFRALIELARTLAATKGTPEQARAAYDKLENDDRLALGSPAYAARSDYESKSRTFTVHVPFIAHWSDADTFGRDVTTRYGSQPTEYSFYSAGEAPDREYFDLPFVGPLVKDVEQRHVDVISAGPPGGPHGDPIAVYVDNRGFMRVPQSSVAEAVADANAILGLAGRARGKADRSLELPAESFLPETPANDVSDQKGWLSFTLVLDQQAVRDVLSAGTEQVLRAFAAGVKPDDRGMAEWLAANGRLEDGRLVYDQAKAREDLGLGGDNGGESWLAHLAAQAATAALDLREAQAAATPQERSAALARAFSGEKSLSGRRRSDPLPPQELMRVLVQFVDPMDVSGYFVAAADATSRRVSLKANLELKKGRAEVPMLAEAGALRGRFADPSLLTDGGPKD